jgi:WS/DGAT/MGAT family acyltransferase
VEQAVERLSAVDDVVLRAGEGPAHGHVGQLLVLEPGDTALDLSVLRSWYAARLHRAPAFRRRLVETPLQLHRPVWVDDPDFDLDHHVRSLRVEPGDRAGLQAAVGRLLGLPLDRRRPLWEAWLLEGLDGGRTAVLTKQHLAAVDDQAGDEMAVAAVDVDPARPSGAPPPWRPGPLPDDVERIGRALRSRLRRPTAVLEAVQGAVRARRVVAPGRPPPVFTRPLTGRRHVALTSFALAPVRALKDHHDVSVNDVVLAVCAGGLRRWLDARDALPVDPLLALIPVSVEGDLDAAGSGHQVSPMVSSLATDTRDPVLRIQVIQDATRQARRRGAISARRLRDWAHFAAPAVLGQAGRVAVRTLAEARPTPANLIVANIPGPTVPLFVAGAPVGDLFFFGPLAEGVPLDVTVASYGDRMHVALVGCPDAGPDVGELASHMDQALGALIETLPPAARPD